jgi:DNA-binding GntR family transcriptional regulator
MREDLEGPEPMYRQIADRIAARIADGTYPPNRRVPSESEVCKEFDVSRRTARAAYAVLAERGLVVTAPGKGTYVAPREDS